jgi:Fur family ferric uptake transcriptional regulator
MIDRFKEILKDSGNSFTVPRQTVFEQLVKSGPTTATELARACAPTIDRATTYRTVTLFERLGVVNRIWHGFKSQIELSEIFTPHHHHASCQHCGVSIDIVDPELEKLLSRIAKERNFLALGHVIELTGYCQKCQLKQ